MKKVVVVMLLLALIAGGWFVIQNTASQKVVGKFLIQDGRVCMTQPDLAGWDGDSYAHYADFSIADALNAYNLQTGLSTDSIRAISLEVEPLPNDAALELQLAGESVSVSVASGKKISAVFPGQRFRSHSTVSAMVLADNTAADLGGYRNWMFCGSAYDDPEFEWREPVANNTGEFSPGPGVNVMGGEYACVQGWGLHHHTAAGVTHRELADMLAAWRVQSVRLPVNEHCWLADIEGIEPLNPAFTGEPYRTSVVSLINLLTLAPYNMHVVLDLHWTGSRTEQALDLKPLPDREFAARFWRSAASMFADNPSVMFNLFNEPHVPRNAPSGATAFALTEQDSAASDMAAALDRARIDSAQRNNWWAHWRDGNEQYTGMQTLVDAIRDTGATNHIAIGGLDYAGDLRGWGSYAPVDPLGRLWADNHAYPAGKKCRTRACWQRTLLPLTGRGYGVMFGETGNSVGQYPQGCAADFVKEVYRFAREYTIPALGWTFLPGGTTDEKTNQPRENSCQIPSLITRWPGQSTEGGNLSAGEINDKRSYDPTPSDWSDDATWAGCAALAYLYDLPLDDNFLADADPLNGGAGNCGVALGLSIPAR